MRCVCKKSSCVAVPMASEDPKVMSPSHCSSLRTSLREQGLLGKAEAGACSRTSYSRYLGRRLFHALLSQQWAVLLAIIEGIGRPLTVVVGGSYSLDKLQLLEILTDQVNEIIICGCMAYTFLRLCSRAVDEKHPMNVGASDRVWQLVERAKTVGCKLTLPVDWVYCSEASGKKDAELFTSECGVPNNWTGMDCGEQSQRLFAESVRQAGAVVCFGPTGTLEQEQFRGGTKAMLVAMAELQASGRVTVLADCELEAAETEWNLEAFECRAEAAVVQVRREDVHSVGSKDGGRTRPNWPQVGLDLACGEPVGCNNEVTPSPRAVDNSRDVYTSVDPSTPSYEVPNPVDPTHNSSTNENSASSSGLEADDTRMRQSFASASVKQDNKRDVVGLLESPLGFIPHDPKVSVNTGSLVTPLCDPFASLETCQAGTGMPGSESGLITHPAAKAFTGLVAASSTAHQGSLRAVGIGDNKGYNRVSGVNPNDVLEVSHASATFEEGFRGHNSRGGALVPATPVLSAAEAKAEELYTAVQFSAGDKFTDCARNESTHGHKTRGEAMDPAKPVFSAVASQVQVLSGEHLVGCIGEDVVAASCEETAWVGHGVKAHKHTIPQCAPASQYDKGCEEAELSETDGESKSSKKPIGFRLDLAEPMVISQPVGFRPDFPNPLQASSSLGFRPDLPVSKSSSMGNRHTEPRVYQYGVGCPIHVEPRESTCGETFDKKSEGCDLQGYVARGQWPTWDLSPGTLGGSKPMSYPDRRPEVVNFVMPPSEAVSQGEGGEMGSVGVGVGCASGESTPLRTLPVTPSRIPSSDRPSKAVQPVNKEIRDSSVVSSHNRLCKVEGHDRARTNLSGVGLQEASGQSVLGSKGEVGMREAGSAISIQHMDLSEQASLNCSSMARDKASGSSFSPMLSKVQGILPANLLRPNMALPAWAQRIKYGGLKHAQVLLPQVSSGKMSLASPASIHVSNPQYPLWGNSMDGSGKSMGSRAFPGTATSAPVCSQVQELPCKTIRDLDSASLDLNILQAQGSVCGNANADPSHRPLGFSTDTPPVQGSQGSNANGALHHRPLGFRPDLPQVPGPEQYQIYSDDSDDDNWGLAVDADGRSCWEKFWVDVCEPSRDQCLQEALSTATGPWPVGTSSCFDHLGPSILRNSLCESSVKAVVPASAKVTWHVPLEVSCAWATGRGMKGLDGNPAIALVGQFSVSQSRESDFAFLPNLACNLMHRLLTLREPQDAARPGILPDYRPGIPEMSAWRQMPSTWKRLLSAPSLPRSFSILGENLPGHASISGDDDGNVLAQACLKARWGETSSPNSSFQNSRCDELGSDPSPNSVGFSPQHDPCEVAPSLFVLSLQSSLADDAPSQVRSYPTSPSVTLGAPEGQAGKVRSVQHQPEGQAGKVHSGQHQPEGQAGKAHSVQHQPEGQAGKVHSGQHQPEGQAGKAHSVQRQPEGQAGKVHSGQHQPEGQAGPCAAMQVVQVSDAARSATSGVMPQVQGAEPHESLDPGPIRFRSLTREVQGAFTGPGIQAQGASTGPGIQTQGLCVQSSGVSKGQGVKVQQVPGAVLSAMPQVSGATPNARPQVSGATSDAMPQVLGATLGKVLRASDTTSSVIPQVQSAKPLESLDLSPIRFRSLPRAELGAIEQTTPRDEQPQGTETHAPFCLKPLRLSSPSHGGLGEPPREGSAAQVDEKVVDRANSKGVMPDSIGAHKDQVGSSGSSQVSAGASVSSGTQDSRRGGAGLCVRVMHLDAKVQVDCGRVRASRLPATRIRHSVKYGWPQKHLDPSCSGFSPEPAISSVPQLVGFNPEQGQCKAVQVDEPLGDQEGQGAKVGHNLNP